MRATHTEYVFVRYFTVAVVAILVDVVAFVEANRRDSATYTGECRLQAFDLRCKTYRKLQVPLQETPLVRSSLSPPGPANHLRLEYRISFAKPPPDRSPSPRSGDTKSKYVLLMLGGSISMRGDDVRLEDGSQQTVRGR